MKFFEQLEKIKKQYENDYIIRKNETILLVPGTIPVCRHMLFKPLSQKNIDAFLKDQYKYKIPEEYIEFLKYSNGANLFYVKISEQKISFGFCLFVIYGLPLTPPFRRALDMEEPYDIRIEDLSRHNDIENHWLKCGSYIKDCNFDIEYDIFIDTNTNRVYSCEKNHNKIIESWDTLDQCFCDVFSYFDSVKEEYILQ